VQTGMSIVLRNNVYLGLKTLHIFAVMLFLGGLIIGIFWKLRADRTGDPRIIAYTLEGIIRLDRWLTMPSAALLILFGFATVGVGHVPLGSSWVLLSIALITVSGAALIGRIVPAQRRMLSLARSAADAASFDRASYERSTDQWRLGVVVATVTPIVAVVLMVFKPL
jgi:uncharacterized membrane protein